MKLHLPKQLFTALLAAITLTAPAAWGASTAADFITIGSTKYGTDDDLNNAEILTGETQLNTGTTHDYVVVAGDRTKITSNVFAAGETIVIAAGSYTTTDGTTEEFSGGQLFIDVWVQATTKITNDIILGGSGDWNQGGEGVLRLHETGVNNHIILSGRITVVDDTTIAVGGGGNDGRYNYLEGYINAENESVTINHLNGNTSRVMLSGGGTFGTLAGNIKAIEFKSTHEDGTASESLNYTIGSLTTTAAITVDRGVTINLTGDDALMNGSKLLSMTGAGNITLSTNTTLSQQTSTTAGTYTSQLTGELTVNSRATLDLSDDRNGNTYKGDTYNLSSFSSVKLDNATIEYRGRSTSLKNVTITENGAILNIKDLYDTSSLFTLAETTTVDGDLTLQNGQWKARFQIDLLTGKSGGNIICSVDKDSSDQITIKSFGGYAGKVTGAARNLNLGLAASDVLNLASGSSITNSGTTNIYGQLQGNTTISGGTINVLDSASVAGTVEFSTAINVTGTLENTGTITLNGLNVTSLTGLISLPQDDSAATYSDGDNGYRATQYYVVKNSGSATLNAGNYSSFTYGGASLDATDGFFSQDESGSLLLTLQGAGIYYVNNGEVDYNTNDTNASTTGASGFVLNSGTTLNIRSALAATLTQGILVNGTGTNINLSNRVTLTHNGKVTINEGASINYTLDNATLNLSSTAITSGISSIDMKNGSMVQLHSATNNLGGENAKVAINMSGNSALSLQNGSSGVVWADINVDGSGRILGSVNGDNAVVKGSIKGDGSLLLGRSNDTWNNAWKIESLISDNESGKLSVTFDATNGNNGASKVTLSGANTYSGGTTIENGHLYTEDASALGTGKVTVNAGGVLSVAENLNLQDTLQLSGAGKVQVATGKSLNLQDKVILSSTDGTNAATMTAKADVNALARLQEDASFTIQDMTLTNTTVTAATTETRVKLQNVEGSTALLAKGAFTLHAAPTVGMSPNGDTPGTLSYTNGLAIATDASATLTLNLDVVNAVAGDAHGTYDLTITLSGFGEGFAVTQDILSMVGFDSTSWLGQALVSQKAEYTVVTEQTPATSGEGGVPTVSYAAGTGANVGSLVITISGLNVPEPASATLGLAALMMLCARRRRKA